MIPPLTLAERNALTDRLHAVRDAVASDVADALVASQPERVARLGAEARPAALREARLRLDFLAAAVQTGSPRLFEDHVSWVARVLASRGVPLAEERALLVYLDGALRRALDEADATRLWPVVAAAITALGDGAPTAPPVSGVPSGLLAGAREAFLRAILAGDRMVALATLREALRTAPVVDVYTDVVQGAMEEVGRRWERNEIDVATEHLATAVAEFVLARLYAELPKPALQRRAVVCGVAGDRHQVGAQMIADVLEAEGWDVRFLGADVPSRDVVQLVRDHRAALVAISATLPSNLGRVRELVEQLRALGGEGLRILVGGRAFAAVPSFALELQVDGYAGDARSAAMVARRIGA